MNTVGTKSSGKRVGLHTAQIMLLTCAAIWGGSYVSAKFALEVFSVQWLMLTRLVGACALIGIIFYRQIRKAFDASMIIPSLLTGITYYGTMILQTAGLRSVEPGRSAFLTAAYCVIAPFAVWIIMKKRPTVISLFAAVICLTGVGFIALKPGMLSLTFSHGDVLTLGCAVSFAFNLTFLGYYSREKHPIALTFGQFLVAAVLFAIGALLTEPLPNITRIAQLPMIANLVYLVGIVTVVAQIMQNYSLSRLSAANASVIMCTESLFTLVLSSVLYNEKVSHFALIGFVLIFGAILLASLGEHYSHKKVERAKANAQLMDSFESATATA